MSPLRWISAFSLAAAAITAIAAIRIADGRSDARLGDVRSWHYQLQSLDLDRLAASPADMLVVDFSQSQGAGKPMRPLEASEVERLKKKPGGGRRIVLAYLSIGEAEEYRYYWQPQWKAAPPPWIIAENCRWPRNHLVRFWDDAWKDVMIRGDGAYLARIEAAGFDGVYLDRIDVYDDIKDRFPDARQRMIAFVGELDREARRRRPDFLVVAQNAEDLLDTAAYRSALDGLAKEDLLYGLGGTGKRNTEEAIAWSRRRVDLLRADGKPVFAAEYLTSAAEIDAARKELEGFGYLGTFPTRALDGTDPLAQRPGGDLAREYGTPEFTAAHCNGVWKKPQS